ncbi:chemotaxis protein CheW [Trinickia caryophylli]|uniref:Purine-binding chemotaxis protein CheW n=1 Tax=Trinickia caryophylli TaxID=28094 RepID=A0A1X7E0H3_TRICW|nr:chemotaxis protein CheW [Trinickia caryophylli]PMS14082.1 chemotaxis protein CheW [Trinickia caryophylli]TRX17779.1 purine-binding chemotaxis protein CheW [Trinickia caryophylli]WQE11455.1 chemotaxis protein CheW [Trinickia caryophylli]SMF25130.1 purine-binding chemotaxis protein CheW [Trinickia caryophylli]GLU32620.1 chemotaxis protein CheW [Trinickia caryophylli]
MNRSTQPDSTPPAAQHSAQYLTFVLGGEMFGIGILTIKEIIEFHDVTPVPMMPRTVRGVINLRGAVVPVVDLQARFGRDPRPVTKRTCIVIVELGAGSDVPVVGVVVDGVSEVLDIAAADIEPAPAFGAQLRTDFIAGMAKVRERFVILLSVEHVLAIDDLAELVGERHAASPELSY